MYQNIPFWKFALAVVIVSLPLGALRGDWAWRYVLLILLMFTVVNYQGVKSFAGFIRRSIQIGG